MIETAQVTVEIYDFDGALEVAEREKESEDTMSEKVMVMCWRCSKWFALGYEGIIDGDQYKCDTCAGVVRLGDGRAISKEVWEHGLLLIDEVTK